MIGGLEDVFCGTDGMDVIIDMVAQRKRALKETPEYQELLKKRKKQELKGVVIENPVTGKKSVPAAHDKTRANWYAFATALLSEKDLSVDDALHEMGMERKNAVRS